MSSPALSAKARAALDAICDTFAPGGDGLPSATEMGVPEALLGLVARNPRAAERKQVAQLLGLWDTAPAVRDRRWRLARFSSLSQDDASRSCSPGRTAACSSAGPRSRRCARAAARLLRRARRQRRAQPGLGRDRLSRPARPAGHPPPPTIEPLASTEDTTSSATSSWSARAPAAAPPRPCWRRRGSTWSSSRPGATSASRTSTATSCPASTAST